MQWKNRAGRILLTGTFAVAAPAWAQPFGGEVAAGYLATDGNTQARSINGKLALLYKAGAWNDQFQTSLINTTGDDNQAAERYTTTNQLNFEFSERNYAFFALEYEKDLIGATRVRTSESLGYGRHVLTGPVHFLDLELGGGARQTELNVTGEERGEAIARGGGKYELKLSTRSRLLQNLKVESGKDNTFTEAVSELRLPIVGALAANLAYTIRNNSNTPPETEATDTQASVSLSYSFGRKP